jgi:hypothetical protein
MKKLILALVIIMALGQSGCSSALWEELTTGQSDQRDLVGEVERVDTSPREIHLRDNSGRTSVVGYDASTRVIYRGREYSVNQLEAGDIVAVELKRGLLDKSYANLIRVQESVQDRGGITTRPGTGIQTVDGRVERVDIQRGTFEIRDQSRERVLVSLPYNARRSDVDRFRALREGDYVRVEGRFLDRERFELDSFLRDDR